MTASARVAPLRSASNNISGLKIPAHAEDDVSVAGKREPSSSPNASTSMPNGGRLPRKCSAARIPAITPKGPSYLPASITVSMWEPISRRLAPCPSSRPRTVPSASSFTVRPAARIHSATRSAARRCSGVRKRRTSRFGSAEIVPSALTIASARAPSASISWSESAAIAAAYHGRSGADQRSTRCLNRAALFLGFLEPVHAGMPLQGDDCTLDRLKQQQREDQRQRQEHRGMDPVGRLIGHLDMQNKRHDQVPDDHDDQIGRKVVGPLVMQFLAADIAAVRDLEEAAEHAAVAAIRAAPAQAAPQRGLERRGALRLRLRLRGICEEIHGG